MNPLTTLRRALSLVALVVSAASSAYAQQFPSFHAESGASNQAPLHLRTDGTVLDVVAVR